MYKQPVMSTVGYLLVFGGLLTLTAITVGVSFINLGAWSGAIAVIIAVCKASLVVLFFMHVRFQSRLIAMYAVGGFYWLGILLLLLMTDVSARGGAAFAGQQGIRKDVPWLDTAGPPGH